MNTVVTLKSIKSIFKGCPELLDKSDLEFCKMIFPDAYNPKVCNDSKTNNMLNLASSTLRGLMSGNRKASKNNSKAFSAALFSKHLKQHLEYDSYYTYQNGTMRKSYKDSMLDNISVLFNNTYPKINSKHPIFNESNISANWHGSESGELVELKNALSELLAFNTDEAIIYVIFLYVLIAVFGEDISDLSKLYSQEAVRKIYMKSDVLDRIYTRYHAPFCDNDYIETEYNIYLFRGTVDSIYESATLKMTVDANGRPTAMLVISDSNESVARPGEKRALNKIFKGVPVKSDNDDTVYMVLRNEVDEEFAFLCFKYQHFNTGNMYYRTGLFISCQQINSHNQYPSAQKACICRKELTNEELICIRGMLSIGSSRIILTEEQLINFVNEIDKLNLPFADEFKRYYLPFIELHKKTVYLFDEMEIISSTLGSLTETERIKLMLMLKDISETQKGITSKFICADDHIGFHKLVK